jgi:hypothetical protein
MVDCGSDCNTIGRMSIQVGTVVNQNDMLLGNLILKRRVKNVQEFERKRVKKHVIFLSKKVTHFVSKNERLFFGQKRPKVIFFHF